MNVLKIYIFVCVRVCDMKYKNFDNNVFFKNVKVIVNCTNNEFIHLREML